MNLPKEITIDGQVYVAKEPEKKKREPIVAWANVYEKYKVYHDYKNEADKECGSNRIECVKLIEEIPGAVQVTKEDLVRAMNHCIAHDDFSSSRMARNLGFPAEGE